MLNGSHVGPCHTKVNFVLVKALRKNIFFSLELNQTANCSVSSAVRMLFSGGVWALILLSYDPQ